MNETILFCFVFLSQILMISWFYPRRILGRTRYVLNNYPPSTHPKLYPQTLEHYERWLRSVARINLMIVVAGLLIIGAIAGALVGIWEGGIFASSRRQNWSALIVAPFFLLQWIAGVGYMHFSAGKLLRAMAKAPQPRVRTAELHRRRLVDFVSPARLIFAGLTNVAFVAFVLYSYQDLGLPRSKMVVSIATVALSLLVFSVTIGVALRARKLDPYQAQQDRHTAIKLMVQQALVYSIAFPVMFAALLTVNSSEPVMTSVFVQGIALTLLWGSYRYRVEQYDFDVYRQDAGSANPVATAPAVRGV